MNISLTLNFDTMSELEAYLASRTNTVAAVAGGTGGAAAAPAKPAAATATPAPTETPTASPAPVATPVKPTAPAPAAAPVAAAPVAATVVPISGAAEIKTRIMDRLKTIAASLPDQSELGKFITAFGVSRFSELPDDRLEQFEQLMNTTYPV